MITIEKICKTCNKYFTTNIQNEDFCSKKCKKYNRTHSQKKTCIKGAVGELKVCADLLDKNYEVFRSVSSTASVDLIIKKEEELQSVEVKTAHRKIKGLLCEKTTKANILACFIPEENKIEYFKRNSGIWERLTL
jgi:hypothetical protein